MKIILPPAALFLMLTACSAPSPATTSEGSLANQQAVTSSGPENLQTYSYGEDVVLQGTLISAPGETPDHEKIVYSAVQLDAPVNVEASSDPDDFDETEKGVLLIQLVLDESTRASFQSMRGSRAILAGSLFHSHTGHHQTDVLMLVTSIRPVAAR